MSFALVALFVARKAVPTKSQQYFYFTPKNKKKPRNPHGSEVSLFWRGREDLNLRGAFYTPYSLSRVCLMPLFIQLFSIL